MSSVVNRWSAGVSHTLTTISILAIATWLPVVGTLLMRSILPPGTSLESLVVIALAIVGYVISWWAGRWLTRRVGNADDARPAVLMGGCIVVPALLETGQGLFAMIGSVATLSLPTLAMLCGVAGFRWNWGRYRFVAVWFILFGLCIGLLLVFQIIQDLQLSRTTGGVALISYAVVASIGSGWLGRVLHRRWKDKPVHAVLVLIPAILTVAPIFGIDTTQPPAAVIAAYAMIVAPTLVFVVGLLGLPRRRGAAGG